MKHALFWLLRAVPFVVVFQELAGNQVGNLTVVGLKKVSQLQHAISIPCPVLICLLMFCFIRGGGGGGVGVVGSKCTTPRRRNQINAKSTTTRHERRERKLAQFVR